MKVLFILHLPPPIHGASMMGKYIQDSKLINEKFECEYLNLGMAQSLEEIGSGNLKKIKQFIVLLFNIKSIIRKFNPDIVYITPNASGGAFYKDFLVVLFLKLFKCKIIAHYHNKGVSKNQNKFLDNHLYNLFFKNIKVILLSRLLYNDIEKYVKKEDVYYCANGIPKTLFHKLDGNRNNQIPHILFLSNLIESKGVYVLLDACKNLRNKGYEFICDFVGAETVEITQEIFETEIIKRNLQSFVIYHGKKYGDNKITFLLNTDVFVFPTYYSNECFPLVLLEAMEYSIPCISTNEAAIPEIIENENNGLIVKSNDIGDLTEKIEILLNNHKMRLHMSLMSSEKFSQKYTIEHFENNIKNIIEDFYHKTKITNG